MERARTSPPVRDGGGENLMVFPDEHRDDVDKGVDMTPTANATDPFHTPWTARANSARRKTCLHTTPIPVATSACVPKSQ